MSIPVPAVYVVPQEIVMFPLPNRELLLTVLMFVPDTNLACKSDILLPPSLIAFQVIPLNTAILSFVEELGQVTSPPPHAPSAQS